MTPAETAHLEAWKKGSLAQATTELFEMSEAYRDRPLAEFNLLTGTIANEARKGFQEQFGITSVAQFNHMNIKLKNAYIQLIVAALNDALPLDYPHIVALVYSEQTPQIRMCSMERRGIPGAHDLMTQGVVPILCIKNKTLEGTEGFQFTAADVEYIYP